MKNSSIAKLSPLYNYWNSEQSKIDENERLSKINKNSKALYLYQQEPYKWENLFQCIMIEIIKGDKSSLKALSILLDTLSEDENSRIICKLRQDSLLDEDLLSELFDSDFSSKVSKKKPFRFLKIIVAIFTNSFNLEIKGEKKHIYEKTGHFFMKARYFLGIN